MSNFNPTIPTGDIQDVLSIPYNYNYWIQKGVLEQSAGSALNRKFVTFNADLTVNYIHFIEITFTDGSTNALFFPFFGAYRWLTANGCIFELMEMVVMTQEGSNVNISNSIIDISQISRVAQYQSMTQCGLYQQHGSANNQIWNNNTFTGISQNGYTALIYTQNHCNVTITNNNFTDFQWVDTQISINVEHFPFPCPIEAFTQIQIENNTLTYSGPEPINTYLYYTITLNENGVQNIIIRNNKFQNALYIWPGFFSVIKTVQSNLDVAFENNYFSNVYNDLAPQPLASIQSPVLCIKNITVRDSNVSTFLYIQSLNATLSNLSFFQLAGLSNISLIIYIRFIESRQCVHHNRNLFEYYIKQHLLHQLPIYDQQSHQCDVLIICVDDRPEYLQLNRKLQFTFVPCRSKRHFYISGIHSKHQSVFTKQD